MEIKVFSEREVLDYIPTEPYIHISITSPENNLLHVPSNKFRKMTLYFQVHDLDHMPKGKGIVLGARKPYKLFNEQDAKRLLYWLKLYIKDIKVIVVNCEAGISRSAGVAGALDKILNNDDDSYFFKNYCPNMLIYSTILKEFYDKK